MLKCRCPHSALHQWKNEAVWHNIWMKKISRLYNALLWILPIYDTGIFHLNAPHILCSSPVNMSRSTSTVMQTTAKHTRQVDTKLQTVWESFRQNAALAGGDPPATRLQPHRSMVARRSPNWSLPRREQAEVDNGAADNACDLCCGFRCEYYSRTWHTPAFIHSKLLHFANPRLSDLLKVSG